VNIFGSTLNSAVLLGAVFWLGSAVAAPLPSYPYNSGALFAAVMQDAAPVEETESTEMIAPDLQRQLVNYATPAAAGTVIIDTAHTYLYFVLGDGKAIRYGIGVGREGFTWSGAQTVTRMAEWPDWTPPQEMIERQPYLPRWMAGGKGNPLGARAIYLGSTVYRIHGTNAPATIGTRVSSGCIRLTNTDVTDLYSRVTVGTKIIVLSNQDQVARTTSPAVQPRFKTSAIY
jgi:lipoprotein-anchoring transpeptidase ErfK/SrfK